MLSSFLRKIRIMLLGLYKLFGNTRNFTLNALRWKLAWRAGGLRGLRTLISKASEGGLLTYDETTPTTYKLDFDMALKRRFQHSAWKVKISVLVPTFNTQVAHLHAMVNSVLAQIYPHWELVIIDDASTDAATCKELAVLGQRDPRIRVLMQPQNHGVAAATNEGIKHLQGDYVVFLDHDDMLETQALYRVAESIAAEAPDFLYSDEFLVNEDNSEIILHTRRPAYSPELLRNHPYIVHLLCFRTAFLRQLNGLDANLKISQDYDLVLRATEQAQTIVHIPECLYRWRVHGQSSGHTKASDVMATSMGVIQRHLQRIGSEGISSEGLSFNYFDTRYPLHLDLKVAIIIPTKNLGEFVRQCIESIRATTASNLYDIFVIDHQSDDPDSMRYFDSIKNEVTVLKYEGVFNFSSINNFAVKNVGTTYSHYLLCNNDIEAMHTGWLERMLELGQQKDIGIVGSQLLYPDRNTIQHAGVCVGIYGIAEHYGKFLKRDDFLVQKNFYSGLLVNKEVSAVTAACLLIRADAFAAIDGFDESLAVGFGDVDLCLRVLQLGYRILFCPHATLVHHESLTRGKSTTDPHPKDSARFLEKWHPFIAQGDPYYNPGLSLDSTHWLPLIPVQYRPSVHRRIFTSSTPTLPTAIRCARI